MKWLFFFTAVHGLYTTDQCRVLRQVRLAPAECHASFAAERTVAANYARNTNVGTGAGTGTAPSGGNISGPAGGQGGSPIGGGPSNSPGGGGISGPGGGGSASGGSPGSPGNPGGGSSPPSSVPSPPITTTPPKPPDRSEQIAALAKLRDEIHDAARKAAIDRIINGIKPPNLGPPGFKPPGFKPPDKPGLPGSRPKAALALGPAGLRGVSSQATDTDSGSHSGQAR